MRSYSRWHVVTMALLAPDLSLISCAPSPSWRPPMSLTPDFKSIPHRVNISIPSLLKAGHDALRIQWHVLLIVSHT